MKWLELSIRAPQEYVEPLSAVFQRHGYGGVAVELEGGYNPDEGESESDEATAVLRSYLPLNSTTASSREQIRVAVALISLLCPLPPLEERVIDENEWLESWKDHFTLLHIGRLVVRPSWMEYEAADGEVVIGMDPGMAFGTGHHPTTRMCLAELDKLVRPGMSVLDVGTGSGILTIAAAKLGAGSVRALDVDPVAVRAARANVRDNGVRHKVRLEERELAADAEPPGEFDLVVANLYTNVILKLAPALVAHTAAGGALVVSGIMADRAGEVERALGDAGCPVARTEREGDWAALVARKSGA